MQVLNQDLDWSRLTAARPDLGKAFRGVPDKTLIPTSQTLCRFITTESKKRDIRGNEIFLSPWWMDWNTTFSMLARWKALNVTSKNVIRAKLAVTKQFSEELDSFVQIVLTKPVYAWKGIAGHQDDAGAGRTYIGGGVQLYLPNLAADGQGLRSDVAYLHCFTAIESLD